MNLKFLLEYIKDIRRVGAVAPSSRYLARKMVESVDFDTAKVIIEYGPGTGVFTAEIIKRMGPQTKLLVIETNPAFYKQLQAKYKTTENVEIINTSAENVGSLHAERSLSAPDYIISGLPFAALPGDVSQAILKDTVKLLGKKGVFITFQYTLLKKGLLQTYFNDINVSRELRNIPPAYILRCR
jgi:phospholipid N-methyltransferase